MTQKTLKVEGMSCGHCELSVQEALDELDGVKSANADHEKGTVEVAYDESRVTDEQFKDAIKEVGYTVAA